MTIQTKLSIDRCVIELKRATVQESLFGTMSAPTRSVICKLTGNAFRLREKRFYRNGYARFFYGKFHSQGVGTEITGEFRMDPLAIAFVGLWFGFLLLMAIVTSVGLFTQAVLHRTSVQGASGYMLLVILGMSAFKFGLLRFSRWLARGEEARVTQFLYDTFVNEHSGDERHLPSPISCSSEPVMWRAVCFFGVLGIISISGALSGISSFQTSYSSIPAPHSFVATTRFPGRWGEISTFINGVFLLLMAYAIWKRLRTAWEMGFAFFALCALDFVINLARSSQTISPRDDPLVYVVLGSLGGLAIGVFWAFWWYKKRSYFDR